MTRLQSWWLAAEDFNLGLASPEPDDRGLLDLAVEVAPEDRQSPRATRLARVLHEKFPFFAMGNSEDFQGSTGMPCLAIEKRAHSPEGTEVVCAPSSAGASSDAAEDSKNRLQKRRKQKKLPDLNIAATHSNLLPPAPKKSFLPMAARKCIAVSALSTVPEDHDHQDTT